jgi:hypothetical protein
MKQILIYFLDSEMEIWGQLLQNIRSSFLTVDSQDQYSALYIRQMGHMVVYWLRHYAASWKVTGSSPDELDFLN